MRISRLLYRLTVANFSTNLMFMQPTSTTRLAAILLGQDLEVWVKARRAEGKSWLNIARELGDATNGQVTYSHEGLRSRYGHQDSTSRPDGSDDTTAPTRRTA
jgi:hypothetical protein